MANSYTREKKTTCGNGVCIDLEFFKVSTKQAKKARAKKFNASTESQVRLNEKNAVRHFDRLLFANFTEKRGWFYTLTYSEGHEPETKKQGERDLDNFIRRLRYFYRDRLDEFKYIAVTETKDKDGEAVRCHQHAVLPWFVTPEVVESLWGITVDKNFVSFGFVVGSRLNIHADNIQRLRIYITKTQSGQRRWKQSKNLTMPKVHAPTDKAGGGKLEELARGLCFDKQYWSERYPGYYLAQDPEVIYSDISGYNVFVRLLKLNM